MSFIVIIILNIRLKYYKLEDKCPPFTKYYKVEPGNPEVKAVFTGWDCFTSPSTALLLR